MVSDFQQQPQQQASKPQRLQTQLLGPPPRHRDDFGMQPDPHIPQDQATPTNNSRKTGLRLLVRMRA